MKNKHVNILIALFALTAFSRAQLTKTATESDAGCNIPNKTTYSNWVYKDSAGVSHTFVGSDSVEVLTAEFVVGPSGEATKVTCGANITTSFSSLSTDGLYYLQATGASGTVTAGAIGFINPKYIVVGVTYAPPGSGSSVQYTTTSSIGNTVTVSNSFTTDVGFSIDVSKSIGIPAATVGAGGSVKLTFSESTDYIQGSTNSVTNTISKSSSIAYTTPGTPTFSPVNSDYDFIWLWINPAMVFSHFPANGSTPARAIFTGYALDPNDPVSGQPPASGTYAGGPDIVEVQVGCLNGHFSCPSTLTITNGVVTSGTLARSWANGKYTWPAGEGPGLTTADIANILSFDPLVPSNNYTLLSSHPSTTSDGRFSEEPFPPNPVQYPVGGATESY